MHRANGEGLSFKMTFEQRWEGGDEESYQREGGRHSLRDQLNIPVLIQNQMIQNKIFFKNISLLQWGVFCRVLFALFLDIRSQPKWPFLLLKSKHRFR